MSEVLPIECNCVALGLGVNAAGWRMEHPIEEVAMDAIGACSPKLD
jgi:hypothetical protein